MERLQLSQVLIIPNQNSNDMLDTTSAHPNHLTGAGSGFGAAIARAFAREGAHVIICDINADTGKAIADEDPASMAFHATDVTSAEAWSSAFTFAAERFGHVDILVNNAGTTYRNKPTAEVTEAEFQRVFDVNVKGVFLGCSEFMKSAIARGGGGNVINIASTGASRPRPGLVWYNASKGAVTNASPRNRALILCYG